MAGTWALSEGLLAARLAVWPRCSLDAARAGEGRAGRGRGPRAGGRSGRHVWPAAGAPLIPSSSHLAMSAILLRLASGIQVPLRGSSGRGQPQAGLGSASAQGSHHSQARQFSASEPAVGARRFCPEGINFPCRKECGTQRSFAPCAESLKALGKPGLREGACPLSPLGRGPTGMRQAEGWPPWSLQASRAHLERDGDGDGDGD